MKKRKTSSLKNYYILLGIKPTKSIRKVQAALEKKLQENPDSELKNIYEYAEEKIVRSLKKEKKEKELKKKKVETRKKTSKNRKEKEIRKRVKKEKRKKQGQEEQSNLEEKKKLRKNIFCTLALTFILSGLAVSVFNVKKKNDQEEKQIEIQKEQEQEEKEKKIKKLAEELEKEKKEYEKIPSYDPAKLERYKAYRKKNNTTIQDTVLQVNIGLDKEFYTDVVEIKNPKSILTLVNKYNQLPQTYEPEDLESLENYTQYKLRKEAAEAYNKLAKDAEKDGVIIEPFSAYRPYYYQKTVYERHLQEYDNDVSKVDAVSARPGHSEHQTGLAIDIRTKGCYDREQYLIDNDYEWMKKHAYEYGFIVRYPQGKTNITGYSEEPWQLRYVGKEVAKEIQELDITFDEYYYLKELNANDLVNEQIETVTEQEIEQPTEEKEDNQKQEQQEEEKQPIKNLEISQKPLKYLEKITLKEDARVYSTKFDMEKEENSKKPYLDNTNIRNSYVIVIKIGDELKHINLQETNQIEQILDEGGDIIGYLIANENSFDQEGNLNPAMVEGFYREEDIVTQEEALQYKK